MEIIEKTSEQQPLPPLTIGKHTAETCIVLGAMGGGITTPELAGAISEHGGIPTLSAATPHRAKPHREYWKNSIHEMRKAKEKATGDGNITNEEHRQLSKEGNVFCMIKDIIKTREIIGPQKPLFMNMITDGTDYKDAVAAACANGIDGIVTAGIAFDLPSLTQKYPDIALVPILFDMKFLKKTLSVRRDRYKKTPDAMIIPDVFKTGGHFPENMENEANRLENLMPEIHEYLDHPDNLKTPEEGAFKKIPLIIAGGHFDRKDVDRSLALGGNGVQIGTVAIPTFESGASEAYKNALIHAKRDDIKTVKSNMGGLLIRVIQNQETPHTPEIKSCIYKCLSRCGVHLGTANTCMNQNILNGKTFPLGNGFFDENGNSRITEITSAKEVMERLKRA